MLKKRKKHTTNEKELVMAMNKLLSFAVPIVICVAAFPVKSINILDPDSPSLGSSEDIYVPPKTFTYNYNELNNVETNVPTLTTDLMGDNVDPATGTLRFSHTDVSIPGNFAIDVAITRTLSDPLNWHAETRELGNWSLDIPHVRSNYITSVDGSFTGTQDGSTPAWARNKACSANLNSNPNFQKTFPLTGPVGYFATFSIQKEDYWNGDTVHISGIGSGKLLQYGTTKKNDE